MEETCVWCGRTYEQHEVQRAADAAVPKTPCLLLKSGFVKSTPKEVSHISPITKTVMESISEADTFEYVTQEKTVEEFKSHLLQSQIKVIEAVIEEMKSRKIDNETNEYYHKFAKLIDGGKAMDEFQRIYNKALEDQISSLNETLEFLKKSL